MYQRTLDIYINICHQSASYIVDSSSTFPSAFTTNFSYQFSYFQPLFSTYFSRHILSNVFDQSLDIAAVFQNLSFICFVRRVTY